MTLTKLKITQNISTKLKLSYNDSKKILEFFLYKIINSHDKKIKINNFGTFYYKKTPERLGRNPKTKESYIIEERLKLYLSVSNKVKKELN